MQIISWASVERTSFSFVLLTLSMEILHTRSPSVPRIESDKERETASNGAKRGRRKEGKVICAHDDTSLCGGARSLIYRPKLGLIPKMLDSELNLCNWRLLIVTMKQVPTSCLRVCAKLLHYYDSILESKFNHKITLPTLHYRRNIFAKPLLCWLVSLMG